MTAIPQVRQWYDRVGASRSIDNSAASHGTEIILSRAGTAGGRHPADILHVIDGDTFEAKVHLQPDLEIVTRVRLRGIDAPELKAECAEELRAAQAAKVALRTLLAGGGVRIFNIGPDKYSGRVVADAATSKIPSVSEAMLLADHARRYDGGHRSGWCANSAR